jgi:hypothetical protein
MRDFKKLLIWQLGMDIVDKVYEIVPMLLQEEKYGMRSQMTRSEKEYIKYVETSQGSAFELETHTLSVQRRKWADEKLITELLEIVRREQKMIVKFIEKLEA